MIFIARDSPNRAMSFGYKLISETDRLQEFPEFGRIVPEYKNDAIREIIFRPYRIVYRVNHKHKLCEMRAFGILREGFLSYNERSEEVVNDYENQARNNEGKRTPAGYLGSTIGKHVAISVI